MRCLDQVVGVEHAGEDWHGLDRDKELSTLQIPIVHLTQFGYEGNHYTKANIVNEADEEHSQVPSELVLVIMIKL